MRCWGSWAGSQVSSDSPGTSITGTIWVGAIHTPGPEWTDRQRHYARHLGGEVYTPALVVNGAAILVGSDKAAVYRAIEQATPPPVAVTLRRTLSGLEAEIGATSSAVTGLLATYDPETVTRRSMPAKTAAGG